MTLISKHFIHNLSSNFFIKLHFFLDFPLIYGQPFIRGIVVFMLVIKFYLLFFNIFLQNVKSVFVVFAKIVYE